MENLEQILEFERAYDDGYNTARGTLKESLKYVLDQYPQLSNELKLEIVHKVFYD